MENQSPKEILDKINDYIKNNDFYCCLNSHNEFFKLLELLQSMDCEVSCKVNNYSNDNSNVVYNKIQNIQNNKPILYREHTNYIKSENRKRIKNKIK